MQLREPPKIVSDFLKDDVKDKSKRWSVFTENDKKELVLFLLQKVFCCQTPTYGVGKLNEEYVSMIASIVSRPEDRMILVSSLLSLFNEKYLCLNIIFINIKFTISKIYDSYILTEQPKAEEFKDLASIRKFSKLFLKKTAP